LLTVTSALAAAVSKQLHPNTNTHQGSPVTKYLVTQRRNPAPSLQEPGTIRKIANTRQNQTVGGMHINGPIDQQRRYAQGL
jgi:hypothetical protein